MMPQVMGAAIKGYGASMAGQIIKSETEAETAPRKLSREARRSQLIEAMIETLATRGYARTTLTEVAKQAGLSHGLVNFHFETKEKLLAETLMFLAEEYRLNWTAALERAGDRPAAQLDAFAAGRLQPGNLYARPTVRLVFLLGRGAEPPDVSGLLRIE